jgi:hypothetical protein
MGDDGEDGRVERAFEGEEAAGTVRGRVMERLWNGNSDSGAPFEDELAAFCR